MSFVVTVFLWMRTLNTQLPFLIGCFGLNACTPPPPPKCPRRRVNTPHPTLLGSGARAPRVARPRPLPAGAGLSSGMGGLPAAGAGRARKRRRWDEPGHGCEPEPKRTGAAGGLRARGRREVPDRLVGAGPGRGGSRGGAARVGGLTWAPAPAPRPEMVRPEPAACAWFSLPSLPSPRPGSPAGLRAGCARGCAEFCFAAGTSQPLRKRKPRPASCKC